MNFKNKMHMALELISGKSFADDDGDVIRYDESFRHSPFRISSRNNLKESVPMVSEWDNHDKDIWTEIERKEERHAHQDMKDMYQEGQAWQVSHPSMNGGVYMDYKINNVWMEPAWFEGYSYRLHPYNDLIQLHRNGVKIQEYLCGEWVNSPNPGWYEDTQYRVKPNTHTLYEWMFRPKYKNEWTIEFVLMSEEVAKEYFVNQEYQKTGRSWDV